MKAPPTPVPVKKQKTGDFMEHWEEYLPDAEEGTEERKVQEQFLQDNKYAQERASAPSVAKAFEPVRRDPSISLSYRVAPPKSEEENNDPSMIIAEIVNHVTRNTMDESYDTMDPLFKQILQDENLRIKIFQRYQQVLPQRVTAVAEHNWATCYTRIYMYSDSTGRTEASKEWEAKKQSGLTKAARKKGSRKGYPRAGRALSESNFSYKHSEPKIGAETYDILQGENFDDAFWDTDGSYEKGCPALADVQLYIGMLNEMFEWRTRSVLPLPRDREAYAKHICNGFDKALACGTPLGVTLGGNPSRWVDVASRRSQADALKEVKNIRDYIIRQLRQHQCWKWHIHWWPRWQHLRDSWSRHYRQWR